MRRKITVTKKHIKLGILSSPTWCPVALAVSLDTGNKFVSVSSLTGIDIGSKCNIGISRKVKKFIEDFDCGCKCKPFSFFLDI